MQNVTNIIGLGVGSMVDFTTAVGKAGFDFTTGITQAVANPLVELGASGFDVVTGNGNRDISITKAGAAGGRGKRQCAKLLAEGKAAFATGNLYKSVYLYQQCVDVGGESKFLEAKALAAKDALEKAVMAMEEAAQLAADIEEARTATAAVGKPKPAPFISPETVLCLSDEEYARMDFEDRVDVLRTHLPGRSSEALRKAINENNGDVKKALAAAQGR
jgi:hypothetical protein